LREPLLRRIAFDEAAEKVRRGALWLDVRYPRIPVRQAAGAINGAARRGAHMFAVLTLQDNAHRARARRAHLFGRLVEGDAPQQRSRNKALKSCLPRRSSSPSPSEITLALRLPPSQRSSRMPRRFQLARTILAPPTRRST